jgi:hypothetical protein
MTGAAMAQGRVTYMLEVVRGRSHITSTRKPETLTRAISEVFERFRQFHGMSGVGLFRELLVEDIERRGNQGAATAVRDFDLRE